MTTATSTSLTDFLQSVLENCISDFEQKFGKASAEDVEGYADEIILNTKSQNTHRFCREVCDIVER